MSTIEYNKRWYEANKQKVALWHKNKRKSKIKNGICVKCDNKAANGKTRCEQCAVLHNAQAKIHHKANSDRLVKSHKDYINKKKENGMCARCSNKAAHGKTCCTRCSKLYTQATIKVVNKRKKAGCCRQCGSKLKSRLFFACDECRNKYSNLQKEARKRLKQTCLDKYGNKCECCGIFHIKFLTFDHVNNDSKVNGKRLKGNDFLKWIIKNNFPSTIRILCWNCNSGRAQNNGICPHKE
jgi:hypothetical protein